jgi:hypothetical protein
MCSVYFLAHNIPGIYISMYISPTGEHRDNTRGYERNNKQAILDEKIKKFLAVRFLLNPLTFNVSTGVAAWFCVHVIQYCSSHLFLLLISSTLLLLLCKV